MDIYLVGHTTFLPEAAYEASDRKWLPEELAMGVGEAGDLSEFAGRACYQSWGKPNPATATNEGYLNNIKEQKHYSVLEHGTASFAIGGISRSLTHELIRHRHFSYSQLSQRFCKVQRTKGPDELPPFVVPPLFQGNPEAYKVMHEVWNTVVDAYEKLSDIAMTQLLEGAAMLPSGANKRAREAARCVLPNMTPTQIVITGNHRSWLEFLSKRATQYADAEIREMSLRLFAELKELEPNIYNHLEVVDVAVRWAEDGQPVEHVQALEEVKKDS